MKKAPTPKRKLAVSIVILLLAAAVAIGGTVAVYTSQVFQRSVVRNRDTEAIRFSSDKLYRVPYSNDTLAQTYFYPMSKDQNTMSFTVCNYDQSKNTVFSEKAIDYSIYFAITNGSDSFDYTVNSEHFKADGTLTLSRCSLKGGTRSADTYTITFNKGNGEDDHGDYNNIKVAVTVKPTDPSLTKNHMLQATLIPIEYATTQGVTVSSAFPDRPRGTPELFAAYNLSVSISGGEDDVVISWDASQLDIDPFFQAKSNGTSGTAENGYTTLTIHMNSEDATGAYLIQFYNHNVTNVNTWSDLPIQINGKSVGES